LIYIIYKVIVQTINYIKMNLKQALETEPGKVAFASGMQMGLLIGLVLTLLLVWIYMTYVKSEMFVDPNAMDPEVKALLLAHQAADPGSAYAARKMYGVK
jgi:hypothetical protein